MKKPTQKRVKECLKNIEINFSELIDYIIFYEKNDMDDWATDIIGYIEKLPCEKEILLLINDFSNRKTDDFNIYSYTSLWWALINEDSEFVNNNIIEYFKNSENGNLLKEILSNWLLNLDDETTTKENILKILNKSNKSLEKNKIWLFIKKNDIIKP